MRLGAIAVASALFCLTLHLADYGAHGSSSSVDAGKAVPVNTVFGAGWTADSLANLEIGRFSGRTVSYRFLAMHSGSVSSVRVFFVFRTICDGCYANGNGGNVTVELKEDDGSSRHVPGSRVLARALVQDPMKQWNRVVELDRPATLQSGKVYHIVFSNPLPSATRNYVSIDDLYTRVEGGDLQPSGEASQLAVLFKTSGAAEWEVKKQHVPILSVNFDDGYRQGQGYIDVKRNAVVVAEGQAARESFTFLYPDRSFRRAAVRVQPTASKGQIELQVSDSEGHILASHQFLINTVADAPTWEIAEFSPPVLFKRLGRYSVTVIPQKGAGFTITPLQKGSTYGFDPDTLFTAGHCETKLATVWIDCLERSDLDIPFYLQ